jgi:hypothetical protein
MRNSIESRADDEEITFFLEEAVPLCGDST